MPLVLTQNEESESGHEYDDVLGVCYEYPKRYQRLIRPGERFVYYRGRRKRGGGTQLQVYLGVGTIGAVAKSRRDRLKCSIEDFEEFKSPVPFKIDGRYLEAGAQAYGRRAGLHYRQGVRQIDQATWDHIRALGTR